MIIEDDDDILTKNNVIGKGCDRKQKERMSEVQETTKMLI